MTEEEWINRCASRLVDCAGMDEQQARGYAKSCYDAQEDFESEDAYTPEEVADEEMSLWDEPKA